MTNEHSSGETFGAKTLMFAMIAGTALLFLEATWSPTFHPAPEQAPVAKTSVQHKRLAQN
jgi:hypothetical protein